MNARLWTGVFHSGDSEVSTLVRITDFAGSAGRIGLAAALTLTMAPALSLATPQVALADEVASASAPAGDEAAYVRPIKLGELVVKLKSDGVSGVEAITNYLTGQGFTKAEVMAMDVEAIRAYRPDIANEISWLKGVLSTPAEPEVEPEPTPETPAEPEVPADPETPDEGTDPDDGTGTDPDDPEGPSEGDQPAEGDEGTDDAEDGPNVPDLVVPHPVFGGVAAGNDQSDTPAYPEWSYNGDTTYVPHNVGVNMTTEKFIAVIGEQAREIAEETGLYASVMIAQAILESASGNSALASAPYNNLFGIKGAYEGESVSMRTIEYDDDAVMYVTEASFRDYPTVRDSLMDYAMLLTNSMGNYYQGAWKENTVTYVNACDFLQGRYATDISYSAKLQDLITTYDLTRYDEPLGYELVHTYEVVAQNGDHYSSAVNLETGELQMEQRDLVDLVLEATSHLGEDYVWGGTTPGSFDCSGLVQYAYQQAMGVSIPRTTYFQCMQGDDVDFNDLHMGDLLFFAYDDGTAGHVGMYLAEGCFIEAPQTGDVIKVTSMSEKMPTFAKRILETKPVDAEQAEKSTREKFDRAVAMIRTQQACDASDALPISVGGKRA